MTAPCGPEGTRPLPRNRQARPFRGEGVAAPGEPLSSTPSGNTGRLGRLPQGIIPARINPDLIQLGAYRGKEWVSTYADGYNGGLLSWEIEVDRRS
jgi:hypothetical protein